MKLIAAPDSFKGSLSAAEAADIIVKGISIALPQAEVDAIPLADGGEGTVDALVKATNGRIIFTTAAGPLGRRIESFFGILGDGETAVVEMAAASGLALLPENERNPLFTTSFGTGELIKAALDSGCRKLILGIGGSATNDGGIGAIQALGGKFLDSEGNDAGICGRELNRIRSIDLSGLDKRINDVEITVACDVDNPLTGNQGASAVFGPQKGATPEIVAILDDGLRNLADVIRRDLGVDIENLPGAGAAGGMGAASVAFLGAALKSGIDIVMDATRFIERITGASLIITGEGRIDTQTIHGKTICGVMKAAASKQVPVLALSGGIEDGGYNLTELGDIALFSIVNKPLPLSESQGRAGELLLKAVIQTVRLFSFGNGIAG